MILVPDAALTGRADIAVTRATEVDSGVAVDVRHARGNDVVSVDFYDLQVGIAICLHNLMVIVIVVAGDPPVVIVPE